MMKIRERIHSQKGFTLIELMVVIAILGILAALVLPKLSGTNDAAKNGRMIADLRTIDGAMNMYFAEHKTYSTATIANLQSSGYLNSVPTDATGAAFVLSDADDNGYNLSGTKAGTGGATIHSPGSKAYNSATDK